MSEIIGLVGISHSPFATMLPPPDASAPGTPDWGLMLAEGETDLFANPVAVLAPAAMIVLTATAMNLIGDWLQERLSSRGATR